MNRAEGFPGLESIKLQLMAQVRRQEEIFSYQDEPLLASLACCLSLQFEIGNPSRDRLSAAVGVALDRFASNPWRSEIITLQGEIGIRMWLEEPSCGELLPRHADFRQILHPLSLDAEGRLAQLVIFPAQVARRYRERGLELVIVRDWFLDNVLAGEASTNYFFANEDELRKNAARLQCKLMSSMQVAFFGTHDLADHLLGGSAQGFTHRRELYQRAQAAFDRWFGVGVPAKRRSLVIAYLIGILLDDCTQPVWYRSARHEQLVCAALEWLERSEGAVGDLETLALPRSFSRVVEMAREVGREVPRAEVGALLAEFAGEVFGASNLCEFQSRPPRSGSSLEIGLYPEVGELRSQ